MRLANAMASVPAAMFVDVQQRHVFQLQRCTLLLEDEYQVATKYTISHFFFVVPFEPLFCLSQIDVERRRRRLK